MQKVSNHCISLCDTLKQKKYNMLWFEVVSCENALNHTIEIPLKMGEKKLILKTKDNMIIHENTSNYSSNSLKNEGQKNNILDTKKSHVHHGSVSSYRISFFGMLLRRKSFYQAPSDFFSPFHTITQFLIK